jgi:NAD(P)H-binding
VQTGDAPREQYAGEVDVSSLPTVLLLGSTGRTGRRVLEQLLRRGVNVRVIVRSARRLGTVSAHGSQLTVVEADLLSLSDAELARHVRGCDSVISCLGHVISVKGILGPPRDLVVRATTRLCRAIEAVQPGAPIKFILMSSVSVNHPGGLDTRRGRLERTLMWILRGLMPPAEDNHLAADFLFGSVGNANPFVQWTGIRPDTLREGGVSEYTLHETLRSSLFSPDSTNMANVAHFMCELATNQKTWEDWKGKLPVIVNVARPST